MNPYAYSLSNFLFMAVFAEALFPLVRCHFMAFSFATTGHKITPLLLEIHSQN
jgi:hypothetical protein